MTSDDPTTVRITIREVYQAVTDLGVRMGKVERLLETSLDHEQRIRRLEQWRYALPPTLLLAAISVVIAITR